MVVNRHSTEALDENQEESPITAFSCGERIQPMLYALDVFVPVLDLRQQTVCSIRYDKPRWRYAQAVYALLGWFLTPLTLLTFSGTLKRHLEK
jgi:hypothetical protein